MVSVTTTAGHGTPCPYMKHFHCFRVSRRLMTISLKRQVFYYMIVVCRSHLGKNAIVSKKTQAEDD